MKNTILPVLLTGAAVAPLHAQLIGTEAFTYADGPVANQNGGTGFDFNNLTGVHTGTVSDWDNVFGAPAVTGNALVTGDNGVKREYNGPAEGSGGGDGDDTERAGALRGNGRVFYKFNITRGAGTSWSGASSYDFGEERVFFGVPGGNGNSGQLEWGCSGNGNTYRTGVPADNATHTLVTVLDFDRDFIGLWVDPDSADYYDPADGSNSADAGGAYTPGNWSTAVRLASSAGGTTTWDDLSVALDPVSVGLKDFTDADGDGLPASWEILHVLDDSDDGTAGESAPGAKDGPNGALGDPDDDNLANHVEHEDGTNPQLADTDGDLLDDDVEKALGTDPLATDTDKDELSDHDEVEVHGTDPLEPDTDSGGTFDFTELALGTLPTISTDDPASNGNLELVGQEFFDTYGDGALTGQNGGVGWDYDNSALGETFTGHTTLASSWQNVFGTAPQVQAGVLVTLNSGIRRSFHGGSPDAAFAFGETTGAWREDAAATGVNGSGVLYLKVNTFRQPGAEWSGLSLYNFGAEEIFVGVPSAVNPVSGVREFGIEQSADAVRAFSGIAPSAETNYTIVAKYDFAASRVDLWVNPDLSAPENPAAVAATLNIAPAEMNGTALRLASGGTGATGWDRLVAGTTWAALSSQPADTDGDGMPDAWEDLFGFDKEDPDDAELDADEDDFTNVQEYRAGTDPRNPDSDSDELDDGAEITAGTSPLNPDTDGDGLRDGPEVNTHDTDPTAADTDGDGQSDGGEVEGHLGATSDPLDPDDTVGAPLWLVGIEDFGYADGPVAGLAGGTYFDYDNWLFNGAFIGHTGTSSDWDGTGAVAGGRLVTRESYAFREFNGPTEGPGSNEEPTDARAGAINDDDNFAAPVAYFKATLTRRAGAVHSVFGPDDFDQERLAFGIVDNAGTPQWGIREGAEASTDAGALAVADDRTYTVVGKLDFTGNLLSLWVDPDLTGTEAANAPLVTRAYTGTNWASGVRFASTGTGDTEWDNVVVANTWEQLVGEAPLSILLGISAFDPVNGTLSLTASGIPAGETFHLRSSADLQDFVPFEPPFDFDSTTPQPFVIPVDPDTVPKLFLRAEEGPTPAP